LIQRNLKEAQRVLAEDIRTTRNPALDGIRQAATLDGLWDVFFTKIATLDLR